MPKEIISYPIVQFLLVRDSEYCNTGSMNIEGKYASMIKGSIRHSLQLLMKKCLPRMLKRNLHIINTFMRK
ncbi:hypothetical protein CCY16_00991 [Wolbachia endosymbiont of Wuchereria bancrofti]|nr:hypothetical protein CCY16_00991 [Wolbachia endosymbiont of Wuchereria bancrofti]